MSTLVTLRTGDKYPVAYENCLKRQARRQGFDMLCVRESIFSGWWGKLELFSDDYRHLRPIVFVDVDSFILGDISPLMDLNEHWICREWWPGAKGVQSSVMVIPEETDILEHYHGTWRNDQEFLSQFQWNYIQDTFPGMVGSYKLHNQEAPTTSIVTFHGKPKPPDCQGWAKEVWERDSTD